MHFHFAVLVDASGGPSAPLFLCTHSKSVLLLVLKSENSGWGETV